MIELRTCNKRFRTTEIFNFTRKPQTLYNSDFKRSTICFFISLSSSTYGASQIEQLRYHVRSDWSKTRGKVQDFHPVVLTPLSHYATNMTIILSNHFPAIATLENTGRAQNTHPVCHSTRKDSLYNHTCCSSSNNTKPQT